MSDHEPTSDTDQADAASIAAHEEAVRKGWSVASLVVLAVVFASLGGLITWAVLEARSGPAEGARRTFVIEPGTSNRLSRGEYVQIMPEQVDLSVGDHLVIVNLDDEDVSVGPYTVRAGETLDQQYLRPQTLIGECSLSGSGEIRIVVT